MGTTITSAQFGDSRGNPVQIYGSQEQAIAQAALTVAEGGSIPSKRAVGASTSTERRLAKGLELLERFKRATVARYGAEIRMAGQCISDADYRAASDTYKREIESIRAEAKRSGHAGEDGRVEEALRREIFNAGLDQLSMGPAPVAFGAGPGNRHDNWALPYFARHVTEVCRANLSGNYQGVQFFIDAYAQALTDRGVQVKG